MRGVVMSLSQLSSILLVSLLALSTHVLWAQRTSTPEESAVQLPDAPSQVATVSEAQTRLYLTYKGLPLSFTQNQGRTESWMRIFSDKTGYDGLSSNSKAVLNENRGTPEFWGTNKYFIRSAPTNLMASAPTFGHVHGPIHGGNNLDYYAHHIPWAGSAILGIGRQAKAHPHVTSVLKTVHPRF